MGVLQTPLHLPERLDYDDAYKPRRIIYLKSMDLERNQRIIPMDQEAEARADIVQTAIQL